MYRKPAPGYVPSPSSTPAPYDGQQQQQQAPPRPASRPLPSSPQPPTAGHRLLQQQQQPYRSSAPISDEEAFELGYPDRPRSLSPNPLSSAQGAGLQALYGAAGQGVNVTGAGSQYGALPQSAYDEPNPFQDPAAGSSYGMGGGYDAAPQIRVVPAQHQEQPSYAPPPSHSPVHAFSPPPPQSYHPAASPYQLPPHRALSPIANPGLSAFDATLAAFNNGVVPSGGRRSAASSAVSSNYNPSAVSAVSFQHQQAPPPQHQQPYVYHPGQAVDPEQYAGYDRFTPKNLYGENQPARLRSRSPTPPLEEDLGDGGRSPSLEEHFAGTAVDRSTFKHLLPPTDFEQGEKAGFLEDLANGDLGEDDGDDDDIRPTQHFGPAPEGKILRRNKTRRKVKLTSSGNLVVQAPIPSGLATLLKQFSGDTERTRTTYVSLPSKSNWPKLMSLLRPPPGTRPSRAGPTSLPPRASPSGRMPTTARPSSSSSSPCITRTRSSSFARSTAS